MRSASRPHRLQVLRLRLLVRYHQPYHFHLRQGTCLFEGARLQLLNRVALPSGSSWLPGGVKEFEIYQRAGGRRRQPVRQRREKEAGVRSFPGCRYVPQQCQLSSCATGCLPGHEPLRGGLRRSDPTGASVSSTGTTGAAGDLWYRRERFANICNFAT